MLHKAVIVGFAILFAHSLHVMAVKQTIPSDRVIPISELKKHLKPEVFSLLSENKEVAQAELATHFRLKFQDGFFYDWRTAEERFTQYNTLYSNKQSHLERANDHTSKFAASSKWLLPFNYQNGEAVDAYALRHLARQHKMVDIAYSYFYDNKDPKYIQYFTHQMQSLNNAFAKGEYEKTKDGNGVYEVYRSGYRILNWLSIHNLFLGEESYGDQDQLYTISTLLQHASHLYEHNETFHSGNHQTRGMSALAMLSILFNDFQDADLWFERSMRILGEHLSKEINDDGFQFERSVHYHMSDIANYFYVVQLANINNIKVDKQWENRLKVLFETLVKIAYPDKSAPVLQDDTDDPWAEKNTISGTMTLGYLLFEDPQFGYFADTKVEDRMYWFLRKEQLAKLNKSEGQSPNYESLSFPQTGYYIMRQGWKKKDMMMVISAGLDAKKPDHQHGDMLGIQAMANGNVVLPNYQVRYSLKDYQWFKNSMVKNVALVDDQLQGKQWTGNKGGSGFGKFKVLPDPTLIAWKNTDKIDLFVGSHNGFEKEGISYTRQVIFVKNEFWIIKDNFYSENHHTYKQVWQGHYTNTNAPDLLRSTFADGSGLDILQLNKTDEVHSSGKQGKEWSVVMKNETGNFSFITVLYPFSSFESRIDELKSNTLSGWEIDSLPFGASCTKSLSNGKMHFLFGVKSIHTHGKEITFDGSADIFVNEKETSILLTSDNPEKLKIKDHEHLNDAKISMLKPGEKMKF